MPRTSAALFAAAAAAVSGVALVSAQSNILSLGIAAPFYGLDSGTGDASSSSGGSSASGAACATAWQHWRAAQVAVEYVNSAEWWKPLGITLALEALPYGSEYDAWLRAEEFTKGVNKPTCTITATTGGGGGKSGSSAGGAASAPPCKVLRGAIIGPASSDATRLVQLVGKETQFPLFSYAATSSSLTAPLKETTDFAARQPFFRLSYVDEMVAGGLWEFIRSIGWKVVSILHVRDGYGVASAGVIEAKAREGKAAAAAAGEGIDVEQVISFEAGNVASVDEALARLQAGTARIVVLFAFSRDASIVMNRAFGLHMSGKGWTWLGGEWVREATWRMPVAVRDPLPASSTSGGHRRMLVDDSDHAVQYAQTAVWSAMQGVVGVVAQRPPASSPAYAPLQSFRFSDVSDSKPSVNTASAAGAVGAFPPPTVSVMGCEALYEAPIAGSGAPPGMSIDEFAPFVFDAVWAAADAAARALLLTQQVLGPSASTAAAFQQLTARDIGAQIWDSGATTPTRPSPLTGDAPKWLANGDRYDVRLALVNVRESTLVEVGRWVSAVTPAQLGNPDGITAGGARHSDGQWTDRQPVVWSTGHTNIPPDRTEHADHAMSTALFVAFSGIVISLMTGALMHKYHVSIIPESAAVVLVGALFGLVLRVGLNHEVQQTSSFNGEFFMLVLLPIIIFESGYSLDRAPFFTQLLSINAFAIAGTVISTIVIGLVVWGAGANGTSSIALSFEEAMSFASLLSATDPVATLAVFGALRVDPTLNALVYGESVINDAVSIVLYRSFTAFLVQDVTVAAAASAVGSFFGILFFSVLVGMVVGCVTTLAFRLINLTGILPKEAEGLTKLVDRVNAFKGSMVGRGADLRKRIGRRLSMAGEPPKKEGGAQTVVTPSGKSAAARKAAEHVEEEQELEEAELDSNVLAGIAETALLLLFAYVSFALAETIYLSGIVSSLFCGIAMNIYTRRIMSKSGKAVSSGVFKMLATLADVAVFFQIGLNVVLNIGRGEYHASFITVALVGCLLGRAFNVFPLAALLNCGRKHKITPKYQLQMWWAGLRGAIAFATALSFPTQNRTTIVNATSWICLFTIFAMGSTTTPLLKRLKIPYGVTESRSERAAAVDEAQRDSPFKRLLSKIHHKVQLIMYGRTVLDLLNRHGDAVEAKIASTPRRRGPAGGGGRGSVTTTTASSANTTTPPAPVVSPSIAAWVGVTDATTEAGVSVQLAGGPGGSLAAAAAPIQAPSSPADERDTARLNLSSGGGGRGEEGWATGDLWSSAEAEAVPVGDGSPFAVPSAAGGAAAAAAGGGKLTVSSDW